MTLMAISIVIAAFALCWLWIELSLFLSSKLTKKEYNNNNINKKANYFNRLSFIWYLRFVAISLFVLAFMYMNYSETFSLEKAIQYCLGIIK